MYIFKTLEQINRFKEEEREREGEKREERERERGYTKSTAWYFSFEHGKNSLFCTH
jgi:hypothetical protein